MSVNPLSLGRFFETFSRLWDILPSFSLHIVCAMEHTEFLARSLSSGSGEIKSTGLKSSPKEFSAICMKGTYGRLWFQFALLARSHN